MVEEPPPLGFRPPPPSSPPPSQGTLRGGKNGGPRTDPGRPLRALVLLRRRDLGSDRPSVRLGGQSASLGSVAPARVFAFGHPRELGPRARADPGTPPLYLPTREERRRKGPYVTRPDLMRTV